MNAHTTAPLLARRAEDTHGETLTITHAQLADAVRRTLQCTAPAITQGIWGVLRAESQQAADNAQRGAA